MATKQIKFPLDTNKPQTVLRFGAEQFDSGDSFTIMVLFALVIGVLFLRLDRVDQVAPPIMSAKVPAPIVLKPFVVEESQTDKLIERLKIAGLWDLPDNGQIPLVIINSYPADFHVTEDIRLRTRLFLHTL